MSYLGDFRTGTKVYFKFPTRAQTGARTDQSSAWEAADLRVYRDDSTTERASTAGFTVTGPFDSMTGITHVTIDLADNTDAGFYAVGHDYQAVLYPDETVDGLAVAEVVAMWSIVNRSGLTAAEINAEVVDALATDTYAEAAAVPAATSTLKDKINWLFILARNKITQTSTTQLVRNDADSATVGTSTISDDATTFTRGEFS